MKLYSSLFLSACTLLAAPGASHAALFDVYQVELSAKGLVQIDFGDESVIVKETVGTEDIANLARARAIGAPLPANEVFALAVDCVGNQMRLVVFDTEASQVLVTLAQVQIEEDEWVTNQQTAVFTSEMDFQGTGDGLNGIDDGEFALGATATLEQGCPVRMSAVAIGELGVNVDGVSFDVIVPKARLRTVGGPIASVDLP